MEMIRPYIILTVTLVTFRLVLHIFKKNAAFLEAMLLVFFATFLAKKTVAIYFP